MSTIRAASASTILVLLLAACASDPTASDPTPTDTPSATSSTAAEESPNSDRTKELCRISAAELTEITGVEQSIETSDYGGGETICQVPRDTRDIEMDWVLTTPPGGVVDSHRQIGVTLRQSGHKATEVNLGTGSRGWLGISRTRLPIAQLIARVDGKELYVSVRGTPSDDSLKDEIAEYATGVARAFVANGQD